MQAKPVFSPHRIRPGRRPGLLGALAMAALITASSVSSASVDEDDLLLVDVVLEHSRLANSISAYAFGDSTVVSLAEIAGALEFPIAVDAARGTAQGWFIEESRTFRLDLDGRLVEINGERLSFSGDEVIAYRDSILVKLDTLARWFPVDLRFNSPTLTIEVQPRVRLPIQERESRRRSANQVSGIGPAVLPEIDNPYRLVGPHAVDVGLNYSIHRNTERDNKARTHLGYSALLGGDLAFMDSRIFLSGDQNQGVSDARFTLSRDRLGLPLGLRYAEIGDIAPRQLSWPVDVNYPGRWKRGMSGSAFRFWG